MKSSRAVFLKLRCAHRTPSEEGGVVCVEVMSIRSSWNSPRPCLCPSYRQQLSNISLKAPAEDRSNLHRTPTKRRRTYPSRSHRFFFRPGFPSVSTLFTSTSVHLPSLLMIIFRLMYLLLAWECGSTS